MGIPAFFRWLCDRYPKVVIDVIEEEGVSVEGVEIPVDTSRPNPNNMEFDNLYLDMNNIIHACTHPTDKPAPESEEEMMVEVSKYIDRIFGMVRPRKFLYMAIDGVAPRAKMNQQRSRRFRTAKDAKKTAMIEAEIRRKLIEEGKEVPEDDKPNKPKFDSNCITPGTPFMDRVAKYLEYYISERISTNPGWKNIKVLLSDSNTPGEGEHKIVHWIRQQRSHPNYDPNTRHAFYGLDADLIMLALATHEVNFFILREVVFDKNKSGGGNNNCFKCGQPGHIASECRNEAPPPAQEEKDPDAKKPYQFLRIDTLREYLQHVLYVDNLPFEFDLERALDDFVFLCFFVGNDFLPHLPTLEIRENAIGLLVNVYKKILPDTGYITKDGEIYLDRVETLLREVGYLENGILVNRLEKERRAKENAKRRKESEARRFQQQYIRQQEQEEAELSKLKNEAAAERLRKSLLGSNSTNTSLNSSTSSIQSTTSEEEDLGERPIKKVKVIETKVDKFKKEEEEEEIEDPVKLGEEGWRERYYLTKFKADMNDTEFFKKLTSEYVRGLAWVLKYYYSGCPSWGWYYPFHYAPFSAELVDLHEVSLDFELGIPFRPIQQLMAVLPPASSVHVPKAFQVLMLDPNSPIIEFYPEDFPLDRNGKKQEWLAIALLPFIDEKALFAALDPLQSKLTPEEVQRNEPREELLYVNSKHPLATTFVNLITSSTTTWNTVNSSDIVGLIKSSKVCILPGKSIFSPYPDYLPNLQYSSVASIHFKLDPVATITRGLLPGLVMPPSQLTNEDLDTDNRKYARSYYNNQNSAANRMINHYADNSQYKSHKMTHANEDRHSNNYKPYSKDRSHRDNRHHNRDRDDNRDDRQHRGNDNRHQRRDDNRSDRYDDNRQKQNYRDDNRQYNDNRQQNYRDDNRSGSYRGGRGGGRGGHHHGNRGGHQQPYQQHQQPQQQQQYYNNNQQQQQNYNNQQQQQYYNNNQQQQQYYNNQQNQQQYYGGNNYSHNSHPTQVWVPVQRPNNVQVPPPSMPPPGPYGGPPQQNTYYPPNNWNNNNQR